MQQTPKCKNAPIHTMYVSFVSVMFKEEERKNKKDDAANLKIAPFPMLLASHPSMQSTQILIYSASLSVPVRHRSFYLRSISLYFSCPFGP
jgi:hypothetical protein